MGDPGLLEDLGDDLLERRVLHAHVGQGVPVQDRPQHLGHPRPLDLDVGERALAPDDLAELAQVLGRQVLELELDQLRFAEPLDDPGERPVVDQRARG